jgi:uncharacterized protein YoxC
LDNSVRQFGVGNKTIEEDDQITRQKFQRLFRKVWSLGKELKCLVESYRQEASKLWKEHERREQQTWATLEGQFPGQVNKCNATEGELRLKMNE